MVGELELPRNCCLLLHPKLALGDPRQSCKTWCIAGVCGCAPEGQRNRKDFNKQLHWALRRGDPRNGVLLSGQLALLVFRCACSTHTAIHPNNPAQPKSQHQTETANFSKGTQCLGLCYIWGILCASLFIVIIKQSEKKRRFTSVCSF